MPMSDSESWSGLEASVTEELLDMASREAADSRPSDGDADSTTGEVNNLVPTGEIGADFRAAQAEQDALKLCAPPSTVNASRTSSRTVARKFVNIGKLNIRETDQTLNVMCVGEAGMGKTTFVESYFKTFRTQDDVDRLAGEEGWRVQEQKQHLTRQENLLREAEKELTRLKDEDKLLEAEEERMKIKEMVEQANEIKKRIDEFREEDQESRKQLEGIKSEINQLKQQKDQAKRTDDLMEAHRLKEQLEAKEEEKKGLTGWLQRPNSRENASGPDVPGPQSHVRGPTVEVSAQPAFTIKHKVGDQPPVNLKVTLIDTPGYGDSTNLETTFKKIVDYVDDQFRTHRAKEEHANRGSELFHSDPLVHCVLYFIAPHRLKPVDIAFMKELHKKVNIIPIIAKSDTMTTDEKRDFKLKVRELLQENGIDIFEFHKATIDDMSAQAKVAIEHPWAVIATKDAKIDEDGQIDAKRKYDWGNADAANPQHSDLLALQTLILGEAEAWKDLKKTTQQKYESWREVTIVNERSERNRRLHERFQAKVVDYYRSVPPMYVIGFIILLVALLLVPLVGKHALHVHTESATLAISSKLRAQTNELDQHKQKANSLQEEANQLRNTLQSITLARDALQAELDQMQHKEAEARQSMRQAARQCQRDLKSLKGSMNCKSHIAILKDKVRTWHANSRAWYLESLPEEFLDEE